MKPIKMILLLLLTGLFYNLSAFGQSKETGVNYALSIGQSKETGVNYALSFVPQYLFISGARIDVDIRLNEQNFLNAGPQLYARYGDEEPYEGFGLDLMVKRFFEPVSRPVGLYIAYGGMIQYFKVTYEKEGWHSYEVDGITYMEDGIFDKTEKIYKTGLNVVIGYQDKFIDALFMDVYFGLGYRYSFFPNGSYEDSEYANNIVDFGFRGIMPVGGLKLMVFL